MKFIKLVLTIRRDVLSCIFYSMQMDKAPGTEKLPPVTIHSVSSVQVLMYVQFSSYTFRKLIILFEEHYD